MVQKLPDTRSEKEILGAFDRLALLTKQAAHLRDEVYGDGLRLSAGVSEDGRDHVRVGHRSRVGQGDPQEDVRQGHEALLHDLVL